MIYKRYANSPVNVSRLGFGAWPLGNTAHHETMTDEQGIALVHKALDEGINFFDTAPNYALGRSETLLGKALINRREEVVINSKFGHHANDVQNFDSSRIRTSVLSSLQRLQTHYLDSLLLHNPPIEILRGTSDHFAVLASLKEEGLIKAYGVSIDTLEELTLTLKHCQVEVIELLYNVFSQETRPLLDEIHQRGIALIIKVPLDSGWLTGRYSQESIFTDIKSRWTIEQKRRRHDLVERVKHMVKTDDIAPIALGFLWGYEAVTTVIPGIRTIKQLADHVNAEKKEHPPHLKEQLEGFYDTHIKHDPLPW